MTESNFGVNISGFFKAEIGFGEAIRGNIKAFEAVSIPYVAINFNLNLQDRLNDTSLENLSEHPIYDINIIHINPDTIPAFFKEKGADFFRNKYNIGFWAWELSEFPDSYNEYFDLFNEIWTPSSFCQKIIAEKSPIPVINIPHIIEIKESDIDKIKKFDFSKDKFTFLFMFDYNSHLERKNTIAIIDAFEKAFSDNEHVQLVIKTSIPTYFPKDKETLLNRIQQQNNIIIIEEMLRREQLLSLIDQCDCYISLHRSEGFGLTIAEAMALGKPVIATGYSGNLEFMNINNSFSVEYKMVELTENIGQLQKGFFWADPNILHAAQLMNFVFSHTNEAKKIGKRAQDDMQSFNSLSIGHKMKRRLEYIQTNMLSKKTENIENKIMLMKLEYQALEDKNKILLDKIDILRNLSFVKIKLQFKNFKNKLTGKNRKYFWED
ncbi:glycosyltransferase [Chryseobacterium sp. ISL-6]|uniref:glycosyltransferase n=1 Tax=Chryseobacterium sp. ISL-6 TaxID=2819143 RepID=UPI001BE9B2DB|nr:glycosyltransferase [Chryseobacterium sp. ISL-6]MBT2620640.1 glycosyltransferase [Chryseobacterium sp. ISL-6]